MPPLTGQGLPRGNIMVVDDNPANLKLLEQMLRQHGYEVRSFPRGRLALGAAEQQPPDLILLDINMPEMNGYEVCQSLKSNPLLADIPVIFLSALNAIEDKIKGFQSGGIDYISKPFQFEEIEARVETHLKLRRAQRAEHDLLDRTLRGAVATLWELVQLTSPLLALRSAAIRDIVLWMARRMKIHDPWKYDLASTLCLMGCLALPEDVFEKGYCGEELSPEANDMFRAHPERTAKLLLKIPRLEAVANIIHGQLKSGPDQPGMEEARLDADMLRVALDFDRRLYLGGSAGAALAQLRVSGRFERRILDALEGYSPAETTYEVKRLRIRDLRAGMVLENNVTGHDGSMLILKKGTILNDTWIERLKNYSTTQGVREPLDIRVPSVPGRDQQREMGSPALSKRV
jgi:DNA-binding response OmpR family regulator